MTTIKEKAEFLEKVKSLAYLARKADLEMKELYAENQDIWTQVLHTANNINTSELNKIYDRFMEIGDLK